MVAPLTLAKLGCTLCFAAISTKIKSPEQNRAVEKRGTQGAILEDLRWKAGQRLQVYFIDGTNEEHEKIKKYAPEWTQYANLHFDFVDKFNSSAPPDIRIKFKGVSGFASLLGTDCAANPQDPSMWLELSAYMDRQKREKSNATYVADQERYIKSTILHEFGHALGFIHEQSRPDIDLFKSDEKSKQEIYDYFRNEDNWTKADVDAQVFEKETGKLIMTPEPDIHSIMMYSFPARLLKDGKEIPWAYDLTDMDKSLVKQAYPAKRLQHRSRL
jgi:hypothetical protein